MKLLTSAFAILTLVCPAGAQQTPAEMAQLAKQLMAAGRAGEAVPIYRELVRAMPDNPGLALNLGLALDMSGDKRAAIREYQAVLKLDPQSFPARLLMGTAYLDLGQPSEAIVPLEESLKLQPENQDAQATLADAELALERFATAAARFEKLSQREPSNPKVWYGLGACYEGLAQKTFNDLAAVAPNSAYWFYLVAESRYANDQSYSAFYFYKQALAAMPSLRGVHSAIAGIYKQTDHADWAAVEEQKEKELPHPDCASEKLECDFDAGNFLAVVEHERKDLKTLYWRTRAYNQLALSAYERLGRLPPSAETYELRARIESKRRQYAQAAKDWREALQLVPGNPAFKRGLAMALAQSGDLQEAERLFRELLQQYPGSAPLNYLLGDVMRNAQKPQEAIVYLQKAVGTDPKLLTAQSALGLAYLQAGQPANAIPHLRAALPIDEDGTLHYQLGRAYQAHGDRDLARDMLKAYQEMQTKDQESKKDVEKNVAITPPSP
ncbi:MAG: tetratricopeptide repeat protein [Terriglobia bacterium]|jgi:predicted Zn-dependent protease